MNTFDELPDPNICRAGQVAFSDVYWCLVTGTHAHLNCEYARLFCYGSICINPDCSKFARNDNWIRGYFMKMAHNLPDPDCCETHCITRNLWECLVHQAFLCQYALPFGSKLFCKNPDKSIYAQDQNICWTCHAGFLTLLNDIPYPTHDLCISSLFYPHKVFVRVNCLTKWWPLRAGGAKLLHEMPASDLPTRFAWTMQCHGWLWSLACYYYCAIFSQGEGTFLRYGWMTARLCFKEDLTWLRSRGAGRYSAARPQTASQAWRKPACLKRRPVFFAKSHKFWYKETLYH